MPRTLTVAPLTWDDEYGIKPAGSGAGRYSAGPAHTRKPVVRLLSQKGVRQQARRTPSPRQPLAGVELYRPCHGLVSGARRARCALNGVLPQMRATIAKATGVTLAM